MTEGAEFGKILLFSVDDNIEISIFPSKPLLLEILCRITPPDLNSRLLGTYIIVSMFSNVDLAWSKNPYTMLLENSLSSSSSSISRICEKVMVSMLSPHSGSPFDPASD